MTTIRSKLYMFLIGLLLIMLVITYFASDSFFSDYYEDKLLADYEGALKEVNQENLEEKALAIGDEFGAFYYLYNPQSGQVSESGMGGRGKGRGLGQGQQWLKENIYHQEVSSTRPNGDFYQSILYLGQDNYAIFELPRASIAKSVEIARDFFMIFLLVTLLILAIFFLYLSRSITKPILKLTDLTKKMKGQDFSEYYKGNRRDEIGQLGVHLNEMAMTIESTIGALKIANESLARDMTQLEAIEEERKTFLTQVSHELKTPLAVMMSYSDGALDALHRQDYDKANHYIEVVSKEVDKAEEMIKALMSSLKEAYYDFEKGEETFNFAKLVKETDGLFAPMLKEKGISHTINLQEDLYMTGSLTQVKKVLSNFYKNVLQYTPAGGTCDVQVFRTSGQGVFKIGNTTKEAVPDLKSLWMPFYRGQNEEVDGHGLGLSIVKNILQSHKFEYDVYNDKEKVVFLFKFPCKE